MPHITSDQLRDISVRAVEDFLNNKVPLSAGLAKQAAEAELNSEQIKRAVEATNTIAYLKVLGMSEDRTVEFPLAKFAEVMNLVTVPDGAEKQAASAAHALVAGATSDVGVEQCKSAELFTGSTIVDDADLARKEQEKVAFFIKEAAANEQALENLRLRSDAVAELLVKQARVLAKDEKGLDKLACLVDGADYAQLSVLVTGSVQSHRDFGGHALFKEAELKEAKSLTELYKEARRLVAEVAKREDLQKRASVVTEGLTKQAFLGALAGGVGRVIGSAVGGTAKAIVKAPAKAVGRSMNNAFGPTVTKVKNMAGAGASKVTGKPFKPSVFKPAFGISAGAALGAAGSIALDASMYNPGRDKTTGRSNDVWDALQRD